MCVWAKAERRGAHQHGQRTAEYRDDPGGLHRAGFSQASGPTATAETGTGRAESRRGDSNPRPTTYEAVALPLSYSGGTARIPMPFSAPFLGAPWRAPEPGRCRHHRRASGRPPFLRRLRTVDNARHGECARPRDRDHPARHGRDRPVADRLAGGRLGHRLRRAFRRRAAPRPGDRADEPRRHRVRQQRAHPRLGRLGVAPRRGPAAGRGPGPLARRGRYRPRDGDRGRGRGGRDRCPGGGERGHGRPQGVPVGQRAQPHQPQRALHRDHRQHDRRRRPPRSRRPPRARSCAPVRRSPRPSRTCCRAARRSPPSSPSTG